jgi:hypothetical protein
MSIRNSQSNKSSRQLQLLIIHRLITINHHWRYIYYVAIALIGTTLLLAFLTFPETSYIRSIEIDSDVTQTSYGEKTDVTSHIEAAESTGIPRKMGYIQRLQIFSGTYTKETFWRLFVRPFALILLPPVLWCSLVQVSIIFVPFLSYRHFRTTFYSRYTQMHSFEPILSRTEILTVF